MSQFELCDQGFWLLSTKFHSFGLEAHSVVRWAPPILQLFFYIFLFILFIEKE